MGHSEDKQPEVSNKCSVLRKYYRKEMIKS